MFLNLTDFKDTARSIIDLLSYDIIAVVAAANRVTDYNRDTLNNLERGIQSVNGNLTSV